MWYPEILQEAVRLGWALENIRIFEDHMLTPGIPVNEVDPAAVMKKMPDYEAHKDVRNRILEACETAPQVVSRNELLRLAVERAPEGGLRIEFGVFEGKSLLFLQSVSQTPVWGIDTFVGFDEKSLANHGRESVSNDAPSFPIMSNAYCIKGRFQDVLKPFLASYRAQTVTFVHYDASDLAAARFVLETLESHFHEAAVIVFDELVPHPHDLDAPEWTALQEFLTRTGQSFRPFARFAASVAVLISGSEPKRVDESN
jgi:hypothetical protein